MLTAVCYRLGRSAGPLAIARQCCYSTVASRDSQHSETVPDHITILSKPAHERAAQRKPFVKSMFLGTVDTELLSFPESLNREEQSRLMKDKAKLIETTVALGKVKSADSFQVYGLQGPLAHGGKQYTETEFAYINELVAENLDQALEVLEHNALVQMITRHCSDEAKNAFLGELCSGQKIAAGALYETNSSRHTMFSTVAELDFSDRKWRLNGSKVLYRTGIDSGLLAVVASTKGIEKMNAEESTIATFLVDTQAKGVQISDATVSRNGMTRLTVNFNQVNVPEEHVVRGGTDVLSKLLASMRVQSSVVRVTLLKRILNALTTVCLNTKTVSGEITDIEVIREQLARMASVVYAAESLIYMTASLMDDFENQDVDLEAAITKVFSAEQLIKFATLPLKLLGPQALSTDSPFEALFNDAFKLYIGDESVDSVNFLIALSGLQYAGAHAHETIKKDRNPAMHPSYVISKLFEKSSIQNPKQFADLQQFFHPSLDPAAHWIEFSIVRLKLAVVCMLSRHGGEVVDRHVELERLANIATMIYAMTASASRASRAYCIGLRHAEHEVHLANMLCREMSEKVRLLAIDLENGPFITNDDNYNIVARNLFRNKGYFFEHALTKNY
ncbi:complex I assembly factor ACAD9, mitochondrial [Anopheles cruzii]|uniref:complex I assembly factor ACAD9, mitochondrial n=1 Tax=Anopheles cruzii TaxID=68878 RepID=UPI0022EC246D|nr:complex I assembly factor ACAD9, mitochondrial [Anopheles cruzii]